MSDGRGTLRVLSIDDQTVARMVTDPTTRRYLEPLLVREHSASELATAVGVPLSTALYRIRRFIESGLVAETRRSPRGGRPIRHYRAVADGFFVPFVATPLDAVELLAPEVFRPWSDLLTSNIARAWLEASGDAGSLGFRLAVDESGVIQRDIVPVTAPAGSPVDPQAFFVGLLSSDAPAVWDTWGRISLMPEDAKELQRELAALLARYQRRERAGARRHIVRLAMAPVDPTEEPTPS